MDATARRLSCRRAAAVALAGLASVLVALLVEAAPLFVLGIALVVIGAAAPAWVWLLGRSVVVRRLLEQDRVVEGEPLEAIVEVRGWLPGGELSDPLVSWPLRLPSGRRTGIQVVTRFERRGRQKLRPPALAVRDPFALAEGFLTAGGPAQEVLVLPRTERVRWAVRGGRGGDGGIRAPAEMLASLEVDGLRPYRPGTPASRIQWSALARGAGLLERRLRAEDDRTAVVVLDARGTGPESRLDAAVRAAASLTLELARAGGCRLLLPGARRAIVVEQDLAAWPAAHARLALVEGGPEARAPTLAVIRGVLGAVFYVTPSRIQRFAAGLGRERVADEITLVIPAELAPRGRATFAVAGCVGIAVASRARERAERAA